MSGEQLVVEAGQELVAALPVAEVTVLEDRAQVVRRGELSVPAGTVVLRLGGVAPVLSDRTVTVSINEGPPGLRVSDTRIERFLRPVAEREAEPAGELEALLEDRQAEQEALVQHRQILQQQAALVVQTGSLALRDIATDVAWGAIDKEQWWSWLRELQSRERVLRDQVLQADCDAERLEETIRDLRLRVRSGVRPDLHLVADLLVQLQVPEAGHAVLEIGYVVPIACWRPQHTARLVESGGEERGTQLSFETDACVWQCTGEDWEDVKLQLSTQRPSLGFEPPLLSEEVLQAREKPQEIVVETREQEIRTTGLGAEKKLADQLPGIDDGGSALTLQGRGRASIPSDGRPYRVPISAFTAPAETGLVLVPELSPAVINRVSLSNRGGTPILAGPVDLVADNGLVGRTPVLFIAPDERFALGFGPDPSIRVRRKVEEVEVEAGALSRHEQTRHTITLLLSSIGTEPRTFEISERIPVSEIEQVQVLFDEEGSSSGAKPDENGFVRWMITLQPAENRTLHLRYTIKKRKGVVG